MPSDGVQRRGWRRAATTLAFAAAYLAAGFLGRQTILEDTSFSLIWPAAGVAVLWFLVQRAGLLGLDAALLAVVSFSANWFTGAPIDLALLLTVTNLVQTLVAVALLRRWCPGLWGTGGERPLDSPKVTAWYLAAASAGMLAGTVLGVVGTNLIGGEAGLVQGVLWFDRNLCGVLGVTTLGLLVGQRLSAPRPQPPLFDSVLELAAAVTFSVLVYGLAFSFDGQPLAFTLLAATVWFGVRFPVVVSAWHSLLSGSLAVALTLAGLGPFGNERGEVAALLVQGFVGMILVSGVVLAAGREERRALAAELRRTEAEAVYQAGLLDAVVTSVVEGLAVVDDRGEVLLVNPAAVDILHLAAGTRPSSLGLLEAKHVDGSTIPDRERPFRRALAGETVRNVDVVLTTTDGVDRVLSVSAAPLARDDEQDRGRAVLLFRDATAEHDQRAELAAFAGVVAHDLRNPLAAIDGWTELLEDEAVSGALRPETVRDYVGRVRSSSGRMHGLILHLLAHATSRDAALDLTRLDIPGAVARVAAARGAEEAVSCREVPAVVGDRVLVEQLLENLIGNALKYVAPGVPPRVEVWGRTATPGWVTISVADNGIGLPTGEHRSIFEEFHRAHGGDFEGTGLGLSIARRIVSRHGGTITARDNPTGQGTVFEFTLPAYDGSVPHPTPVAARSGRAGA